VPADQGETLRLRVTASNAGGASLAAHLGPDADHQLRHTRRMCRNIRVLHNFEPPTTSDEIHDAALQYVRKVSGMTKPSKANEAAFHRAVHEIAHITEHLLEDLVTTAPPKDRELEAAKRKARATARYA
jgi:hypothetical protein